MDVGQLRWELRYPGGRVFTEPEERLSIKAAPRGARQLAAVNNLGTVALVELTALRPVPIVYRMRSIALDGAGIRDDAFVLGCCGCRGESPQLVALSGVERVQLRSGGPMWDDAAIAAIAAELG